MAAARDDQPELLDRDILPRLGGATQIEWLSPLYDDEFAEYRDASFLERLDIPQHSDELRSFWPARGPQWDGLARSDRGDLILVEAKAHIPELISFCAAEAERSREMISRAFNETLEALNVAAHIDWQSGFYQYANRLAHLDLLRRRCGEPAYLVNVYFVGDRDMNAPATAREWKAALSIMKAALGLGSRHSLSPFAIDIFPEVAGLRDAELRDGGPQ